jgi:hypothetical protein
MPGIGGKPEPCASTDREHQCQVGLSLPNPFPFWQTCQAALFLPPETFPSGRPAGLYTGPSSAPLEAESEYRKAAEAAPRDVGRVIDVAAFLSNQGRYSESDELFQMASQTAPLSPKVMFARASAYVRSRRNLPEAEGLLQQYAELPHTPDGPPRAEVTRLMQKLR